MCNYVDDGWLKRRKQIQEIRKGDPWPSEWVDADTILKYLRQDGNLARRIRRCRVK
jgi:hypothetical protein